MLCSFPFVIQPNQSCHSELMCFRYQEPGSQVVLEDTLAGRLTFYLTVVELSFHLNVLFVTYFPLLLTTIQLKLIVIHKGISTLLTIRFVDNIMVSCLPSATLLVNYANCRANFCLFFHKHMSESVIQQPCFPILCDLAIYCLVAWLRNSNQLTCNMQSLAVISFMWFITFNFHNL